MNESGKKKSVSAKLGEGLYKIRYILVGTGIAIVAGLAGIGIWTFVADSAKQANAREWEDFSAFASEKLSGKAISELQESERQSVIDRAEVVVKKAGGTIFAQKALVEEARLHSEAKNWDKAEKAYQSAYAQAKESYLAPLCLFNAAIVAENAGKTDDSITSLELFVKTFPEDVRKNQALFSVGRLSEGKSDWEKAIKTYESIQSDDQDDCWMLLGKSRIIALNAEGKTAK